MNLKRRLWRASLIAVLTGWLALVCAACNSLSIPGFSVSPTFTPFKPVDNNTQSADPPPTATLPPEPSVSLATPSLTPEPSSTPSVLGIWAEPGIPEDLVNQMVVPPGWAWVSQPEQANLRLELVRDGGIPAIAWYYAVVVPFPTVLDDIRLADLEQAWRGNRSEVFADQPLLVTADTRRVFSQMWGEPPGYVQEAASDGLISSAWEQKTWAVVPFDHLEARWKVLNIDGSSVLVKGDPQGYPLKLGFRLAGDPAVLDVFYRAGGSHPASNRDPSRLTVVLMTGTTALVRATGWRMENYGLDFPARDIRDWLLEPDFTHISNEASFNPECPPANPNQQSLMFCSRPEYIQLLDSIDADIIELSGNHNNDWGRTAFNYSLDLYAERGWQWFAGGKDVEEANRPLLIEHNGNRIAFLGCNYPGPNNAWATESDPGAARCDFDVYAERIEDLFNQGYLPVMTFQYNEIYVSFPSEKQEVDFRRMAAAGAAIVSGSQAHFPQGFAFQEGRFIHYGLGNLFFDQMDNPVDGTRREFLDRHVFYNGRHISTEVLTAMLEDYARPRPMTPEERAQFLTEIFAATDW